MNPTHISSQSAASDSWRLGDCRRITLHHIIHVFLFDFYTPTRLDTVQLLHCTSCPAIQAWARLAIGGNVRES